MKQNVKKKGKTEKTKKDNVNRGHFMPTKQKVLFSVFFSIH